jgi:hypothetical protein
LGTLDNGFFYRFFKPEKKKKHPGEEEEQENWGSQIEFFLASLGYVGDYFLKQITIFEFKRTVIK